MESAFRKNVMFLITMLIICGVYHPQVSAATWTGSGSESSPYLIADDSSLRQLATNVHNGNSYSGKYLQVTADIALTETWMPIGTSTTTFCGAFDGKDKTISGMTIESSDAALFVYIGSGAMTDYSESNPAPWSDYACSGCNEMDTVTVGFTVTSVGNYAFANCNGLQAVIFEGNGPWFGAHLYHHRPDRRQPLLRL